jgi:hypothetical protein
VLAGLAGCSLALSGPDPHRPANTAPECDTGKGLVGVDGLFGAGFAIGSLAALGSDEGGIAAITGLISVAFIASAVSGNSTVNECRADMAVFAGRPELPPPRPEAEPPPAVASRPAVKKPAQKPEATLDPEPEQPPAPATIEPPPLPVVARPTKPAKPAKPAAPAKPAPAPSDDWADFWTEVP